MQYFDISVIIKDQETVLFDFMALKGGISDFTNLNFFHEKH